MNSLAIITSQDLFYFGVAIFFVFLMLLASFAFGLWVSRRKGGTSPYTGKLLRRGSDLHWMTVEKVLRYLFDLRQYENRMFDLNYAVIDRDTGRIFQDSVTWMDTIDLNWGFIEKRHPGKFVSWGSLTPEQQRMIREKHLSLEGFQTKFSSANPSPRKIEKDYIFAKPGPLYVDVDSGVLIGWKVVPDTDLELLIVQKPQKIYVPKLEEKKEKENV